MKISENKQDVFSRSITIIIIQTICLIALVFSSFYAYEKGQMFGVYFMVGVIILGLFNLHSELNTIKKLLEK